MKVHRHVSLKTTQFQSHQDFDEPTVRGLLDAALGQRFPDLEVHSVRRWTMDCQVAERCVCVTLHLYTYTLVYHP